MSVAVQVRNQVPWRRPTVSRWR